MMNVQNLKQSPWTVTAVVVLGVFLVLYAVIGYSAGYGEMVDGQLVLSRDSLVSHMFSDYGRDGGEWGFGYFVPLGILGLLWFRREEFRGTPVRPSTLWGGAFLLLGFLFYWVGYRSEQKYFGYAAGQILVLGAILWFLGWTWFRKLFWLWVLLGMMWPWRFLIEHISSPLQIVLSKLTATALSLFGVGAIQNGSSVITDSADPVTGEFISLDIDVYCSGLRSLFALFMVGLIFAFLRVREEWKRWALMLAVPVVAVAGNFVRMLILYGGSRVWGTEFAIGLGKNVSGFHIFAGLMVFLVALLLLTFLVEVLNRGARVFARSKVVVRKHRAPAGPEAVDEWSQD